MDLKKTMVMVVDDDAFVRELLSDILTAGGFSVRTAENGADALEKYEESPPDLFISDMNMPRMDGLTLIKELRRKKCDVPLIMLTANDQISVALEAIRSGADDYLIKDENIQDTVLLVAKRVLESCMLKQRVDSLLKNTLPEAVADEMKYKGSFEPRRYICTILFSDFVKFTRLAELISGESLIRMLDAVFKNFDDLTVLYGGTKIKTIGDAYMSVFGAPTPFKGHEAMALRAGLSMLDSVKKFNQENNFSLKMRVGVHTGNVMAGVVGRERKQFDVFGDAVNTAARFESSGEPGKINVTENTYLSTKNDFEFEERGFIVLKNKADMKAYFVTGERRIA